MKNLATGLIERQEAKPIESHGQMSVEVYQDGSQWKLRIATSNGHVFRVYTTAKLIDALDLASQLQLRVTNELPLNQYYKVD